MKVGGSKVFLSKSVVGIEPGRGPELFDGIVPVASQSVGVAEVVVRSGLAGDFSIASDQSSTGPRYSPFRWMVISASVEISSHARAAVPIRAIFGSGGTPTGRRARWEAEITIASKSPIDAR